MSHAGHHPLNAAFFLTAVFAVVELVGGLMAHSLALLADAGHMMSDVAAMALALLARSIAAKPAHAQMTYGYGRAKVLAAHINGIALLVLSVWIVWEGLGRLSHPPQVEAGLVLWIASMGLLLNLLIMRFLHVSHDLNTRAVYWHVLGDALGSVAAIIAGLVILFTGWMLIDPILSFVVAAILAGGAWRLLRETSMELMEAVPKDLDAVQVLQALQAFDGVVDVHHVHFWRLPMGQLAMSAHIKLDDMSVWPHVLPLLLARLKQANIDHATLQPELCCYDDPHSAM